jgi:antitoxin component of RelBE/YafQ-DinJ toxin-antitoxin module
MQKIILQVPITQDLKINAENAAHEQGFSSLQEIVRVFLSKLAAKKVEVSLESIVLSEKNENRYLTMTKDFKTGKNIKTAKNVDDLLTQLNENKIS